MSTYDTLRHFADSWGLLFLMAVFIGVIIWVLRPGSGRIYRQQSEIPFKHEDKPAAGPGRDNAGGD